MAGITIEVDAKKVQQALSNLAEMDIQEAMSGIGETLLNNTQDRLEQGIDINGQPFTPLSSLTKKLKGKNKDKILIAEGYLFKSLAWQLVNGGKGLEFGSDSKYAAIHQFGGVIKPVKARSLSIGGKGSGIFAKSVTIPERPFIGLTPQDETEILDNLAAFIDQQLN